MPKIYNCCIAGCRESSRNIIDELSFHRMPKDEATRTHWISIIRTHTNQPNVFAVEAMVCSKHFPKTSFIDRVNGSRFLQRNSIPSIFPNPRQESLKTDWSDNDDDHLDPLNDDNEMMIVTSPPESSKTLQSLSDYKKNIAQIQDVVNIHPNNNSCTKVESDNNIELIKPTQYEYYSQNCRFCLSSLTSTQISSLSSEDIARMYESLTGMEYIYNLHHAADIICTTCSDKLKSAIEFREYLIETNNRWEKMISEQHQYSIKVLSDNDLSQPYLLQPKLEVVLVDDTTEYNTVEIVEEYLDEEFLKDEKSESLNDKESEDEDEKFIRNVQEFIKTVEPVESSEPLIKRKKNTSNRKIQSLIWKD